MLNKKDENKIRLDLIEPNFIISIAKVMTFAIEEKDYKINSWQEVPDPINKYYAALMRHVLAWRSGESHDKESGYHHLSHAGCNIMILLWYEGKKALTRKRRKNCAKIL